MTTAPPSPVLIIGAGLSGLGAAHALIEADVPCRILEAEAEPAMPWTRRHPQLRLNTHRARSSLPGLPMPERVGDFPHRDDVIAYLRAYALWLGVPIEHGARVTDLARAGEGWRVETSAGTRRARHVIVATGRDREPALPHWPGLGDWPGTLIHAADLGDVARFRGQRVLVAGAGNSGSDVLNHLARIETAWLGVSVRFGPTVIPKRLFGFPLLRLSPVLARLPVPVLDRLLGSLQRLVHGDLAALGLSRHASGGATRLLRDGIAPAIDDGFVAALQTGRIEAVPAVRGFGETGVELVDGRVVEPDVVIAATGYRAGLEPLLGGLDALDGQGFPRINGAEQLAHLPGLWFTGMRPALTGFFHGSRVTGRAIARAIRRQERGRARVIASPTAAAAADEWGPA